MFIGIIATYIRLIVVETRNSGDIEDIVTRYLGTLLAIDFISYPYQFLDITLLITVHSHIHKHTI